MRQETLEAVREVHPVEAHSRPAEQTVRVRSPEALLMEIPSQGILLPIMHRRKTVSEILLRTDRMAVRHLGTDRTVVRSKPEQRQRRQEIRIIQGLVKARGRMRRERQMGAAELRQACPKAVMLTEKRKQGHPMRMVPKEAPGQKKCITDRR